MNDACLDIRAPRSHAAEELLDRDCLEFVRRLVLEFAPRIEDLLRLRRERQVRFDAGDHPTELAHTRAIRDADWRVAPIPEALTRRIVEITGPPERRMVIHALNSGADVFMADFEDATAPTWSNVIEGQRNVRDALLGTIASRGRGGDALRLAERTATLMVRPRGLHLPEAHVAHGGRAVPAALFDFGVAAFVNARQQAERGRTPCFYLPKLESHLEARLWGDVFAFTETRLGLAPGTLRATVLIETLPAAFEMDEILYELRDHALGLNCGRWDYIFSVIKTHRAHASHVLPDREQLGMTQPFLRAYAHRLIRTCHRRGALALGGMAPQIPVKHDPRANEAALECVRSDKAREALDGHDGTWVAHPGLVPVARAAFDAVLRGAPNQLHVRREDASGDGSELLLVPRGTITTEGLRHNVRVAVEYLASWLGGTGCVPIAHRMEDAATAEICRAQVWQQLRHGAVTEEGRPIDVARVRAVLDEEVRELALAVRPADPRHLAAARDLFAELALDPDTFYEFLTLPAYARLVADDCSPPTTHDLEGADR